MELRDLLARRRMVRSFDATPVDPAWLEALCADALRAPTAGNAAGVRMRVVTAARLAEYFDAATDAAWRAGSARYPGLARAGAAVLVTARVEDYLARYAEPDKAASGLAQSDAWPIPYWYVDAAMATMALLLLVEEAGWQAAIWGSFRHAERVLTWAGADGEELVATVLVGRADGSDHPSASRLRAVPPTAQRVTRIGD
ncbi:MAG: nitroreductase family protein [Acidimicrobiales bacterium]